MIVYHVIGITDFLECLNQGYLPAPVRAWETIKEAERFSKQTGRALIIRLKFPEDAEKLFGHKNMARVLYNHYPLSIPLNGFNYKVWDAKIRGIKKPKVNASSFKHYNYGQVLQASSGIRGKST